VKTSELSPVPTSAHPAPTILHPPSSRRSGPPARSLSNDLALIAAELALALDWLDWFSAPPNIITAGSTYQYHWLLIPSHVLPPILLCFTRIW
jgi:hypothetical protein